MFIKKYYLNLPKNILDIILNIRLVGYNKFNTNEIYNMIGFVQLELIFCFYNITKKIYILLLKNYYGLFLFCNQLNRIRIICTIPILEEVKDMSEGRNFGLFGENSEILFFILVFLFLFFNNGFGHGSRED